MLGRVRLWVVALIVAVGGCATQASVEANRISQGSSDFVREMMACYTKAEETPEYQEVGALLPPLDGRKQASMAVLTNQQVPTAAQSAALTRLYNQFLQPCYEVGISRVAALDAGLGAIAQQSVALGATAYARLASQQVSWGQYAEFQNQLRAEAAAAFARRNQSIGSRLEAQHRQEVQARAAAFTAASNTMYQWQMVTAANQPRTTNCSVVGGYLNCTTY